MQRPGRLPSQRLPGVFSLWPLLTCGVSRTPSFYLPLGLGRPVPPTVPPLLVASDVRKRWPSSPPRCDAQRWWPGRPTHPRSFGASSPRRWPGRPTRPRLDGASCYWWWPGRPTNLPRWVPMHRWRADSLVASRCRVAVVPLTDSLVDGCPSRHHGDRWVVAPVVDSPVLDVVARLADSRSPSSRFPAAFLAAASARSSRRRMVRRFAFEAWPRPVIKGDTRSHRNEAKTERYSQTRTRNSLHGGALERIKRVRVPIQGGKLGQLNTVYCRLKTTQK